jgi:hypothetical protein
VKSSTDAFSDAADLKMNIRALMQFWVLIGMGNEALDMDYWKRSVKQVMYDQYNHHFVFFSIDETNLIL